MYSGVNDRDGQSKIQEREIRIEDESLTVVQVEEETRFPFCRIWDLKGPVLHGETVELKFQF